MIKKARKTIIEHDGFREKKIKSHAMIDQNIQIKKTKNKIFCVNINDKIERSDAVMGNVWT
jgi:hypothetical protein